jgi:tetratricopeptide (TPR) repeat protein
MKRLPEKAAFFYSNYFRANESMHAYSSVTALHLNLLPLMTATVKLSKSWICICLCCFSIAVSAADQASTLRFTPKLQKAYFEIQKLRIDPARELINEERKQDPSNAFIHYLDNYADLHYLLISEDQNAYKTMVNKEEYRLNQLNQVPDSSPFKRFLQAEIRLHWAFAKMKFGNEVSGAWDVIKAYRLLAENKKKFPEFVPHLKSLGLLHVMIGSVPDSYTWVTKFLGLKGDIALGIQELQTVIREAPLFRQEAQLIDLLLHAYILKLSDKQRELLRQLPKTQPYNLLMHFFATTVLMKEGKSSEAQLYLYKAPVGGGHIPFPFLDYLKGEIALQQSQYDEAFTHYTHFQQQYRGFNFIKDSNFKLFMCRWLANDDERAGIYMERVKKTGSTIVEGDKFAQRMADDFFAQRLLPEQKVLFKARYATDGGYLPEALALIETVSEQKFTTTDNKTEFNYRKARILQKSENPDRAIPFYNRAISLAPATSAGFAASSALQLGYIYKEKKELQKATDYFKQALSYKKYDYKNSIDNKARAALTELGQ